MLHPIMRYFVSVAIVCYVVAGNAIADDKKPPIATETERYPGIQLTDIVIGYGLYCEMYDVFKSIESNPANPLIELSKKVDALPGGISTGLAFPHRTFIVQNNINDHVSGFLRISKKTLEESNVPSENILFVTAPIESFGMRVLVVLSMLRPDRTTIFSIDNKLNTELLYDSFNKNIINSMKDKTLVIGSIYQMRLIKPGYFLLEERMEPGGRGFVSPYENRSFILDVTKGVLEMSMQLKNNK